MKHPPVSVCIPSYNGARFVGETIRSVPDWAHTDLEIIGTDDASTDNTVQVVEAIEDPRVHVLRNQRNLGPVSNWNRALELASGQPVASLAHDDLCGPFWRPCAADTFHEYHHVGQLLSTHRVMRAKGRR